MTASKTQSKSAKGKSRDKDLIAFDDNQIDDATAKTEAVERVIGKIFSRCFLPHREGLFFKQMINDVKSYKVDGFTIDDFYLIAKFNSSQKNRKRGMRYFKFLFLEALRHSRARSKTKRRTRDNRVLREFQKSGGAIKTSITDELSLQKH